MSPPGIYGPISFGPWIPAPNISTRRAFKNWKHMGLYKLNPPQWNQKLAHFVQILLRNLHILCDHLSRDQSKYRSNHIDLEIFVTDFLLEYITSPTLSPSSHPRRPTRDSRTEILFNPWIPSSHPWICSTLVLLLITLWLEPRWYILITLTCFLLAFGNPKIIQSILKWLCPEQDTQGRSELS